MHFFLPTCSLSNSIIYGPGYDVSTGKRFVYRITGSVTKFDFGQTTTEAENHKAGYVFGNPNEMENTRNNIIIKKQKKMKRNKNKKEYFR